MSLSLDALWSRAGATLEGSAIRQMGLLASTRLDVISFAPGYPDASMFAWDDYRAIADDILRASAPTSLQYSPTRGLDLLRETVQPWLGRRGMTCMPDELLITSGSQQGIDLLTRVLVDPGDVVLVELPTFTGAIAAFRNGGAHLVGIEQDDEGLDLDHLQFTLARLRREARRTKFLYVIPNFQNPTGGLMSPARRHALLEFATREQLLLVEDDPYGDLYFDAALDTRATRPLKHDDAGDVVVYLQSTSKTLAPAFRTAWAVGPAALLARLEIAKQSVDLCSSGLDQRMVAEALRRGVFERDLPALRARYAARCDAMIDALALHAAETLSWRRPQGGFFVWAEARMPIDTTTVRRAIEAGVVYVGGAPFYVDGRRSQALRLAFSAAPLSRIGEGVQRLASVMVPAATAE